jgi:putative toxin-antitoxin system antitoxin component (TIGR02293 family)
MRASAEVLPAVADEAEVGATFYARVGALLGLKSGVHSEVDLMDRLEKGLPVSTIQALRSRVGLSDEETYSLIAPRRTLNRRESLRQALSREESDRAVRIARVTARARQVFAGTQAAIGGRTPMQALATESGALAVDEILIGIEHGMFG